MAITLSTFASGDADYITKMNSDNRLIEQSVGTLQSNSAATAGNVSSLPAIVRALLGSATRRIGGGSMVAAIAGQKVTLTAGAALLASKQVVAEASAGEVDLTGQPDGTYYITATTLGVFAYSSSPTDALWSVVKTGTTLSALTSLGLTWGVNEWVGAQTSPTLGTFDTLALRLEAIEDGYIPKDEDGNVPVELLPDTIELTANRGAANGYCPLNADQKVPAANLDLSGVPSAGDLEDYVPLTEVGTSVAALVSGTVPLAQIPDLSATYAPLAQPYDVPMFYPGVPGASALVARLKAVRSVTFPSGLTASQADARVAATGSTTFTLKKNGVSVGTILWSAAGTSGAFTSSGFSLAAGDVLTVEGPATADATLADISITLTGTR